jgi:hypothetical protein
MAFLSLGRPADLAAPLAIIFSFGAEGKVLVQAPRHGLKETLEGLHVNIRTKRRQL